MGRIQGFEFSTLIAGRWCRGSGSTMSRAAGRRRHDGDVVLELRARREEGRRAEEVEGRAGNLLVLPNRGWARWRELVTVAVVTRRRGENSGGT